MTLSVSHRGGPHAPREEVFAATCQRRLLGCIFLYAPRLARAGFVGIAMAITSRLAMHNARGRLRSGFPQPACVLGKARRCNSKARPSRPAPALGLGVRAPQEPPRRMTAACSQARISATRAANTALQIDISSDARTLYRLPPGRPIHSNRLGYGKS